MGGLEEGRGRGRPGRRTGWGGMGGYPTHIAAVGGRETEDGTIYIYIYK